MAAVLSPSLFLGERPGDLTAPDEDDPLAAWPDSTALPPAAPSLDAVVEWIEESARERVTLAAGDLPVSLRSCTALSVLRRRAERRGKTLAFTGGSRELQRIAGAAGVVVDHPASAGAPAGHSWRSAKGPALGAARADTAPTAPISLAPSEDRAPVELQIAPPAATAAVRPRAAATRRPRAAAQVAAQAGAVARTSILPALAQAGGAGVAAVRRVAAGWMPALALGGVAGCVALALTLLLLPGAQVTLTPVVENWAVEVPITVDPALKKPDLSAGKLPGRAVKAELSETKQVPTTGRRPAPDARATGTVVFINRSEKPVSVPKGTVVLAGPVKFATQQDVTVRGSVRAGSLQNIGMTETAVTAVNGGLAGNVDRFQVNRIEGPLASTLEVNNNQPTKGGSEKTTAFVTAEDRKQLQDSLYKLLNDRLAQQLKSQLPAADKETAIPLGGQNPSIVEATFSKNEGDEAQSLSLTLKVRYAATVFNNDAYNRFVQQLATGVAAHAKQPMSIVKGTLAAEPPSVTGVENGIVKLTGRARAGVMPRVDVSAVRAQLANKPLAAADAYLGSLQGITGHELRASPAWLHRTPWLGWRIGVQVALPPPPAPAAPGR